MTTDPNREPGPDPMSKERLRLWLKLLKASSLVEEEIRRRLRSEYGSTLPRFDVMSALARMPEGLKMSEISRMLRVSNGNVTGIVDKLALEGLAERTAVPGDRRAFLVRLTDKGTAVFATHAEAHEGWINELLGALGSEEIEGMGGHLDHMTAPLNEEK